MAEIKYISIDEAEIKLISPSRFSIFIHRNLVSDFQGKQENEFLFFVW